MDFTNSLFLIGVMIGVCVSAPVRPIATIVIRQTLTYGLVSGLAAGLASTVSKGLYAALASALSIQINSWLKDYSLWFNLIGGAILIYVGIQIIRSHVQYNRNDKAALKPSAIKSFFQTLFLTFTNPMTTVLFVSWFKETGLLEKIDTTTDIVTAVAGVMFGTMLWWAFLALLLSTVQV